MMIESLAFMRFLSDQADAWAFKRSSSAVPLPHRVGRTVERGRKFEQPPDSGTSGHLTTVFRERCHSHRFSLETAPNSLGADFLNHTVVWRLLIPTGYDENEASPASKETAESANGHLCPLKAYLTLVGCDGFRAVDDQPDDISSIEELKPIGAISVDEFRGPFPR